MSLNRKVALVFTAGLLGAGAMIAANASPEQQGAQAAAKAKAAVGEKAPLFTLTDLDGAEHTLAALIEDENVNAVVLEWFNPECPVVVGHYEKNTMGALQEQFAEGKVAWVRINSGGEGKQGYGVEKNKSAAEAWKIDGPILVDADGTVGKMYGAKTTPHMYVIDGEGVLRYAGAIDDDMRKPTKNYVGLALTAVLAGETVETGETRAYGCSVKYAN